jgi:uncharacterized membrane protein
MSRSDRAEVILTVERTRFLAGLFDPIATVAILALLALVAAPVLMRLLHKPEPSPRSESGISIPETILRARYVRGELDRDQFLLMREDLRNQKSGKHDDEIHA